MNEAGHTELLPDDASDAKARANVRPADWTNPQPAPSYNLVVVGAGTAGLVTAAGAAALGARVALVEKNLMGGDCLNFGCVPSKALLRAARFHTDLHHAPRFAGSAPVPSEPDFAAAMERMRRLRAHLSRQDSAKRFRAMGVDVFLGEAAFADRRTVEVAGATLKFTKAVVATGSRAARPPIPGLAEAGYLTNETVFNLTERPRRLLVIGGGPLGCELAQAFACLGCEVIIANRDRYFLPDEERDAAEILADALRRDGIEVRLNTEATRVAVRDGAKHVCLVNDNQESTVAVDEILVGVGRVPNV
ncbi:MAG: FAD-dependent oxidoreductase, partial [Thermoanaerobaculia bacterium]